MIDFICKEFGEEYLEQNLNYMARVIGGRGSSRTILRKYFKKDFYKDHCHIYTAAKSGQRPIYWLFQSGKKRAFQCLIYIHSYQENTIETILKNYLRPLMEDCGKESENWQEIKEELEQYEKKMTILARQKIQLNMDDGVRKNYAKLEDLLARIK